MKSDNYKITQYSVSSILNYVENSQIAIPEIQRPFVWKGEEVRALIDSLYEGYPIGYLIVWQNSQVRVRGFGKGGTKKILIDGQQRVTALMAALLGKEVLDEQYQSCRIRIAFNPLAQTGDERFAVCDEKHEQDSKWIPDISIFFRRDFSFRQFEKEYKDGRMTIIIRQNMNVVWKNTYAVSSNHFSVERIDTDGHILFRIHVGERILVGEIDSRDRWIMTEPRKAPRDETMIPLASAGTAEQP